MRFDGLRPVRSRAALSRLLVRSVRRPSVRPSGRSHSRSSGTGCCSPAGPARSRRSSPSPGRRTAGCTSDPSGPRATRSRRGRSAPGRRLRDRGGYRRPESQFSCQVVLAPEPSSRTIVSSDVDFAGSAGVPQAAIGRTQARAKANARGYIVARGNLLTIDLLPHRALLSSSLPIDPQRTRHADHVSESGRGAMETAAVAWAREVLAPDRVTWIRTRPWAEVWQLDTADDRYWLKINFRRTVYEPRLLELLQRTGADLLPPCIVHGSQPWALIRDAGQSARETLADVEPGTRIDFWCRVLAEYAELQRASRPARPDGRRRPRLLTPPDLLDRFDEALAEPGWLAAELVPPDRAPSRTDPGLPPAARRSRTAAGGRSAADRPARRPARRQRVHPRRPDHAHRLGRRGVRAIRSAPCW